MFPVQEKRQDASVTAETVGGGQRRWQKTWKLSGDDEYTACFAEGWATQAEGACPSTRGSGRVTMLTGATAQSGMDPPVEETGVSSNRWVS